MKFKNVILPILFAASGLLMAQIPTEQTVRTAQARRVQRPEGPSRTDRIVVQHRPGADSGAVAGLFSAHEVSVVGRHNALNVSILRVDPAHRAEILDSLDDSGLFTFAEPDYIGQVTATPNDPNFTNQWHLQMIQAPSAWNITTGSASVRIGMVDSGVDWSHPDLASKLVPGWSFLTNTTNTQDTMGHGTATAGTAAASSDNGAGGAGVAWQNQIVPLQVADSSGSASYSAIANAITYAADHGIRIVNISIGGTSSSSLLQSAVSYAWSKGTVVFASAGNGNSSVPMYPAACQYVVAVSATNANDTLAGYSSYGSYVSLSAPGDNIFTTSMGGSYGSWSGTSFSSPVAAGVAALVLSYAPSLSAQALVNVLEQNTDDLGAPGYDQYYGWGRVNAYKALLAVGSTSSSDNTAPTVTISSPSSAAVVLGAIGINGTVTDNVGVSRIEFYLDGNLKGTAYTSPFSFPWDTSTASNATHTLTVKAYDPSNNVGQATVTVSVNNPAPADTQAPAVSITSPASGQVVKGSIQIAASASDNAGVTQVSFYVDGVLQNTDTSAPFSYSYDTTKLSTGTHSITAKAWDQAGNVGTSAAVTVTAGNATTVRDTQSPTAYISSLTDQQTVRGSIPVTITSSDNIGVAKLWIFLDNVQYGAVGSGNSYTVIWDTTSISNGHHTLKVKVADLAGNNTTSTPITINIQNTDTQAPTISVNTPIQTNSSSSVTVSVNASDNLKVTQVTLYVDGALVGTTTSSTFTFSIKAVAGTHTLVAKAVDAAGNVGTSVPVTFNVSAPVTSTK